MSIEHAQLFQTILQSTTPAAELETQFPFYPLTSPGMPLPGPDFVEAAVQMGDSSPNIVGKGPEKRLEAQGQALHYLYRRALYDENFALNVMVKNRPVSCRFLPGHLHAGSAANMDGGPRPAKVMVLGKGPEQDEFNYLRNFSGPKSEELFRALQDIGITDNDIAGWYFTNLIKFQNPDPNSSGLAASWIKDCMPLLHQEFRLVRPDFILCLGSEASKALLGSNYSVTSMVGRVMELEVPLHEAGEEPRMHKMKVMTAVHPAAVFRTPELSDDLQGQLALFWQLVNGGDVGNDEKDIDHGCIYKERELSALVDQMLEEGERDPLANIIAIDGEWDKELPCEQGAYLRTIQISNKPKWARAIVLRHRGGYRAFQPDVPWAIEHLKRLFGLPNAFPHLRQRRAPVRVGGHFLRADMPWLMSVGLDLRDLYAPHPDPNVRDQGGWDTSLQYHSYNETARLKLEDVATRLTTAPRYDAKLQLWRKEKAKQLKMKDEDLEGYGECPDHILLPYGCYDADVTRRIMVRLYGTNGYDGLMARDWNGNDCWHAYHVHHMASLAFLEMEMTGFSVDNARADQIALLFMETQDRLLEELRRETNWPAFNPRSAQQCVAMLFGDRYVGKINKETRELQQIRPMGAICLNLRPVKSTGKRSKAWADLEARGGTTGHSPSTDKEVLGILGHHNPIVGKLRDYKFVSQVLTSVLRRPNVNDEGEFERDEAGHFEYEKGLLGSIMADGKVHTHLFQTKETARASSARPPLQNISSRREDDYRRILGDRYQVPIRSILCIEDGWVGIDSDLTGAELAVLAWLCQDRAMIDHVRRNNLPEDHEEHYDIHSQQACRAFRLTNVVPTKTGMKNAGKKGLRVAAKNVNFGIPYGRGADAIARQCKEEGVDVSVEECQVMIDAYFESYPGTWDFLAECRRRSQEDGWLVGPYGSYRRFMKSNDRQVVGEQERQAQNFPIQNGVADAVSIALYNFRKYREEHPELQYKLVLQIHDAVVLMCPIAQAERIYNEVIPTCMIDRVPFWPRHLDGKLMTQVTEPYHFGVDREIFTHWGVKVKGDKAREMGMEWAA